MSKPNFFQSNVVYHDNSTEYNIDARGNDLASVLRACEAEDIEPVQEQQDEPDCFPLLTERCRKEGKVHAVEAELRTACQGTAIGLWRAIRTNEALGYIAARHLDSRDVYNAFSRYFGELPYKERNFRKARNER